MSKYAELIERLEKLTGPDRELDLDIWCELFAPDAVAVPLTDQWQGPDYTGSIDAALTLKSEDVTKIETEETRDWFWCKFSVDSFPPEASGPVSFEVEAAHKYAPIALCIAALRTREESAHD